MSHRAQEDSCSGTQDHASAFAEYAKMRDGLNATGRPIFFSLCGWEEWCVYRLRLRFIAAVFRH